MQTHGGTAAAGAIESRERRFLASLMVDWNRNGLFDHPLSDLSSYLDDVSVDRSLRGTAPEELLLIEGAAAAELVATVHGAYNGLPFSGVFSPYNTASPLYGKDVIGAEIIYRLGVETPGGVIWYPQFTGRVRTASPDRSDGAVEITALDRAELLRRPVTLPYWAVSSYQEREGAYGTQLISSQWVIDTCLRQCDTSPTPYRPATREEFSLPDSSSTGTQFWMSGTGSLVPTVGYFGHAVDNLYPTDASGAVMYRATAPTHPNSPEPTTAPLALAALGTSSGDLHRYSVLDRDQILEEGTHYAGFTLVTNGVGSDYYKTAANHSVMGVWIGARYFFNVAIGDNGKIWSNFWNLDGGPTLSSPKLTIPTTGSSQRVELIWDPFRSGTPQVFLRCGTATTGGWVSTGSAFPFTWQDDGDKGTIVLSHKDSLSDVFYGTWEGNSPSVETTYLVTRPAKYAAVLDQSKNRLCTIAAQSGTDAWDVITEVAAAEYGSVFWDESGIFRFWNYDRVVGLQSTAVRSFTLDDVTGLKLTNSLDSVRNMYSVKAKRSRSHYARIFKSDDVDQFYTPGGTVKYFTVPVDHVVQPDPLRPSRRTNATWRDSDRHRYVVQWFKSGAWVEDDTRTSGVDIRAYFDETRRVVIEIWNGYGEPCRLANNNGEACLAIGGTVVEDYPEWTFTRKNLASVNKFGGRNFELASDWHQESYDALSLATTLLGKTSSPTPATDAIRIAGDPRLQLGDCISIADPDAMGSLKLQIYGIRRVFSRTDGLSDTLTIELVRPAP
ncbi:hypothetical protein JOD54_002188 [Actinokineospora baliensis]|uniref:hypothetical protein n=1 Tax=Actinokineospora baliensis TaxID=547056 RepID=UPI00195A29BD|nr:hypothetical protein [Actinokineospora baliensis]MBM7771984.1 hypothetical protein [Actinokineospora baliensis]